MESTDEVAISTSNSTTTTLDSPASVNILSLPPELILEIFERAVLNPRFYHYRHDEYEQRLRTLSALALVHSSWTQAAQKFLIEVMLFQWDWHDNASHVWFEEQKRRAIERAEGLASVPTAKTRWLSITEMKVKRVLEFIDSERRRQVQYLTLAGESPRSPEEFSVKFLAQFTHIEALKLYNVSLVVWPIEPLLSFVHLRRLVLGHVVWLWDLALCRTVFSPACMPNLTLLALDGIFPDNHNLETLFETEDIFHFLLPQLTSLAISESEYDSSPTTLPALLYTPRKLSRLWISVGDSGWVGQDAINALNATNAFSDDRAGLLELDSLHIAASEEDGEPKLASRLKAIAKGQEKGLKVERIIVYGSEETRRDLEGCPDVHEMQNIEWRLGESLWNSRSTLTMVNILSFPPELTLKIFDKAVAKPPFPEESSEYQDRLDTLSALALVHPSWTGAAQELLNEVVQIGGPGWRDIRKEAERFGIETLSHGKTKWLSIIGHVDLVLDITGYERWSEVRYLFIDRCNLRSPASFGLDFRLCASFPRVETLKLESKYFTVQNFEPGLSFIHLRRLVLGSYTEFNMYGDVSTCQIAFSPASMPNLTHLSVAGAHDHGLRIIQDIFILLLPQITTLALLDISSLVLPSSDILRNLSHLSLTISDGEPGLLSSLISGINGGLKLESLHLGYLKGLGDMGPEMRSLLAAIAKEKEEERRISRIVLYGSEEARRKAKKGPERLEAETIEWRVGVSPPFEDFDPVDDRF
ncbi:uncharacterized protein JCM6883_006889 [Sporobolomyces salmoneus]|uniref:uncharacterized protein n=1 Tax=Sporobolomyces salmoneus TaxID=183962 RepID=UPI0031764DF7